MALGDPWIIGPRYGKQVIGQYARINTGDPNNIVFDANGSVVRIQVTGDLEPEYTVTKDNRIILSTHDRSEAEHAAVNAMLS